MCLNTIICCILNTAVPTKLHNLTSKTQPYILLVISMTTNLALTSINHTRQNSSWSFQKVDAPSVFSPSYQQITKMK